MPCPTLRHWKRNQFKLLQWPRESFKEKLFYIVNYGLYSAILILANLKKNIVIKILNKIINYLAINESERFTKV